MAFKYHDDAAEQIYDKNCKTILENGSKCEQQHCCHVKDICEAGSDPDRFKDRICPDCRMTIFWYLRNKTEDMRLEKVDKVKTEGKDYFIATGYHCPEGWQYEHVNSRSIFNDPEEPLTEEIIASVGARWLEKQKGVKKEKTQTKLTDFFN
ncbi:Hypothetical predicted protein [Paramuricea clavata]|uniref:Uncharacterized protein n=1 Tax=Paramuricea clavata TaxID=317549 RepID=A0A7D9H858_PARCT|nr:Hypothetical predicted protein [Paramuricea clavata]